MNGLCLMSTRRRTHHGYSKMEVEDPEEVSHRRAQFLIHKSLQKVDSMTTQRRRSQPSTWLKLRVFRLKIRIGKRLKRLRKSISLSLSAAAKGDVCRHVSLQLKSWKRLLRGRDAVVPPLLK